MEELADHEPIAKEVQSVFWQKSRLAIEDPNADIKKSDVFTNPFASPLFFPAHSSSLLNICCPNEQRLKLKPNIPVSRNYAGNFIQMNSFVTYSAIMRS